MAGPKLHGRAFYESIGSPKYVLAPMVDQSEFTWRMLTRSFLPSDLRASILAYSPMFHAKLFAEAPKYRLQHFEPLKTPLGLPQSPEGALPQTPEDAEAYLDGNPEVDRPLFVQFCANDSGCLLEAAKLVAPYCDAVDLNLGCPQGIAKRGHYGSFLQEDWETIHQMISRLHAELEVPVTAKMRILETKERTLEYAKMILNAGASIITVHGRQRDQKGHKTGLADYSVIRYLREQLPPETVIFANGNILQHGDIRKCIEETGADGVMSAEGNLYDPSIFAEPPLAGEEGREYWRGRDGKGGYRVDAVLRRYLDITHQHVLGQHPPERQRLFLPSDDCSEPAQQPLVSSKKGRKRPAEEDAGQNTPLSPSKKQKRLEAKKAKQHGKQERTQNPNLVGMQAHCFHILRPLVAKHHDVRDALAQSRAGDIEAFENVLQLTEVAVREGLLEYEADPARFEDGEPNGSAPAAKDANISSDEAVRRCRRPYWVCQPYVRPLPQEALENGSIQLSKKEKKKLQQQETEAKDAGVAPEGKIEVVPTEVKGAVNESVNGVQLPKEGMVCG